MSTQDLNPPFIQAFFLGLPRRVSDLADQNREDSGELTTESHDMLSELVRSITDRVDALLQKTMSLGYPPNTELDASNPTTSGLDISALQSGATQIGRHIAAIPITGWAKHPQELNELRAGVDNIATTLRAQNINNQ